MLAHIGYVPRTVIQYAKYLLRGNSNAERFKARATSNILQVVEDEAVQIPDRCKRVRIRLPAMISTCKAIDILEMRWSPLALWLKKLLCSIRWKILII